MNTYTLTLVIVFLAVARFSFGQTSATHDVEVGDFKGNSASGITSDTGVVQQGQFQRVAGFETDVTVTFTNGTEFDRDFRIVIGSPVADSDFTAALNLRNRSIATPVVASGATHSQTIDASFSVLLNGTTGAPVGAVDVSTLYPIDITLNDGVTVIETGSVTLGLSGNFTFDSGSLTNLTAFGTTLNLDYTVNSRESVAYNFSVGNDSDTIFVVTIVETVDGVESVIDSFASQPGDFSYNGTLDVLPDTALHTTVLTFIEGVGPVYNWTDEAGADWIAAWQINEGTVPTTENAVGLITVGDHDGIITLVDQATGEELHILDLSEVEGADYDFEIGNASGVDVQLTGSGATLTQLPNGDWVVNPTVDGPPTAVTSQHGSFVNPDGTVTSMESTEVTSGGETYDFSDGVGYREVDGTLERIDAQMAASAANVPDDLESDQEGLGDDLRSDIKGVRNGDGTFAMVPGLTNNYNGIGRASEWVLPLPAQLGGYDLPAVSVPLDSGFMPVLRQGLLLIFTAAAIFTSYRVAQL